MDNMHIGTQAETPWQPDLHTFFLLQLDAL